MYKVVLIDDEAIILEGLQKAVDWEGFQCNVVGCAKSAEEGAQLIHAEKPDILFTDIQMPDQDGLTLLAGLRSEFPHMQVTVLTGHRDFAYAQQALHLGVSRFLLKPSKMAEIEEAIQHMIRAIGRAGYYEEPAAATDEPEGAVSFVVQQAEKYIRAHYAEKLVLTDVAAHCFVSQWHLSKLFKKYLNQNFYEIVNAVRIEQAKLLLKNPAYSISNICDMVGYNDAAHFSKVFKRLEGMSAKAYRAAHCND